MQRAVAGALQKTEVPGPLAERDTIDALDDFLRLQGVQDQERTRTKKLLCSRTYAGGPREAVTHCQIKMTLQLSSLNKMTGKWRRLRFEEKDRRSSNKRGTARGPSI